MVVTVEGDRVTKVGGNPDHPFTRGGLGVKVTDFPNHLWAGLGFGPLAGPVDVLPTWHAPAEMGADDRFPLALISPKAHAFLNSQYANMDEQLVQQGPQTCPFNPADAAARGIADRSPVRVFNDRASVNAIARVGTDIAPGVVVMPMGHWPSGSPDGLAVNALNATRFADLGRAPTFSDTAVEVEAVAG